MMNIDYEEYIKALNHALESHHAFDNDLEKLTERLGKKEEGLIEICKKVIEMADSDCGYEEFTEMNDKTYNFLSKDFIDEMNNKIYEFRTRYEYLLELRNRVGYLGQKIGIDPELDLSEHYLSIMFSHDIKQMTREEIKDKLYSEIELEKEMANWESFGITVDEVKEILCVKSQFDLSIEMVRVQISIYDGTVSTFRIKKHDDLLMFEELDGERNKDLDMI